MRRMIQTLTLALFVMVAAPLFAQQHESGDQPMAEQMEKMHSHMQAMQEQMKEIKATKDPEKRKELMQEHRQSMHEAMMMMGSMDKGMDKGPMAKGGMQHEHQAMSCAEDDAQCQRMQSMEKRQGAMQERMQMMQMMMQQMMENQSAQADQQ